jgi:hypothetical protein
MNFQNSSPNKELSKPKKPLALRKETQISKGQS